jgi:hypothetical protein
LLGVLATNAIMRNFTLAGFVPAFSPVSAITVSMLGRDNDAGKPVWF